MPAPMPAPRRPILTRYRNPSLPKPIAPQGLDMFDKFLLNSAFFGLCALFAIFRLAKATSKQNVTPIVNSPKPIVSGIPVKRRTPKP